MKMILEFFGIPVTIFYFADQIHWYFKNRIDIGNFIGIEFFEISVTIFEQNRYQNFHWKIYQNRNFYWKRYQNQCGILPTISFSY
jgi:hypothetical protein